jgi:NAD/NADP transhydrogenase alpha subunit
MKITVSQLRTMVQEEIKNLHEKDDKWIQKAVDPDHEGYCTPMSKPTCTPKRKAFAKRAKSGDINKANLKKGKNPRGKG